MNIEKNIVWNVGKIMVLVMGICELFWGFPVLGGTFIVVLAWWPLLINFVLHMVIAIINYAQKNSITPSVVGMVANAVGFIPFLGMILHLATAGVSFYTIFKKTNKGVNKNDN